MADTFSNVIGVVVGVTIAITVTVISCAVCYRRKRNISDVVQSVSYRSKKTASEGKEDVNDLTANQTGQSNARANVYSSVFLGNVEPTRHHDNSLYSTAVLSGEKTNIPHETTSNDLYDVPKTPKSFHLQDKSANALSSGLTSYDNIKELNGMSTAEQNGIPPTTSNDYINTSTLNEIVQSDLTKPVSSPTKIDTVTNGDIYYSKADDSNLLQIAFKENDGADDVVYDVCRDDINHVTTIDSGEAAVADTPSRKPTHVYTKLGQQKREFKSPYNIVSPDNFISEQPDIKKQFPRHEASYYNVSRTGILRRYENEASQQTEYSQNCAYESIRLSSGYERVSVNSAGVSLEKIDKRNDL